MPVGSIFCKKQAKNGFLFPVSCFIMNHNTKDEYTAMSFREDAHMKIAVLMNLLKHTIILIIILNVGK